MKTVIAGHGFPYRWNPQHPARVGLMPRGRVGGRHCLVRGRSGLHLPRGQRLRHGRRAGGDRRLRLRHHVRRQPAGAGRPFPRAGALDRGPPSRGRFPSARSMRAPRSSPAVTNAVSASPIATAYSVALPEQVEPHFQAKALYRHDLEDGTRQVPQLRGRPPSRRVRLRPRRAGQRRGEGWVVGLVIDSDADTTDLVILDAQDFTGEPVASVHLPHPRATGLSRQLVRQDVRPGRRSSKRRLQRGWRRRLVRLCVAPVTSRWPGCSAGS